MSCPTLERDIKSGKVYYCGADRLVQLYPIMATKKYKPAMKAELMEGKPMGNNNVITRVGHVLSPTICPHGVLCCGYKKKSFNFGEASSR